MNRTWTAIAILLWMVAAGVSLSKDVSGPQVGEAITPFTIRGILDDEAGKDIDLVKNADGKPLVIVFLHERTRPSVVLARQVLGDAGARAADGLTAGLVLLTADSAATEDWVKIATQALPRGVPIGIFTAGAEGPPAYNLNRKVQMTVIVAKNNRVVANFALAQPSPTDDAPKIGAAVAAMFEKRK